MFIWKVALRCSHFVRGTVPGFGPVSKSPDKEAAAGNGQQAPTASVDIIRMIRNRPEAPKCFEHEWILWSRSS